MAAALVGSLRATDRVGRLGGEEFLIVAPQTDANGALALGERVRQAVEQTTITYNGETIPLTVSIGFAVAEVGVGADIASLEHAAAAALAAAKERGRNRVEVHRLDNSSSPIPSSTPARETVQFSNTVLPNGKCVRQLREDHCWTQEELARRADVSKRTIEYVETSKRVRRETIHAVAKALRVSSDRLLSPLCAETIS